MKSLLATVAFSVTVSVGLSSVVAAQGVIAEQREILDIAVGKPTLLSARRYQNDASVAVSRTGVVAAFYSKPLADGSGTIPKFYRTSTDGARTWGEERVFPPGTAGRMSIGLREGVLFVQGQAVPVEGGMPGDLKADRIIFSDDFLHHEIGNARVILPDAAEHTVWAKFWPAFDKGKVVQLANGGLLATMFGNFVGDTQYRTIIVRSTDLGKIWNLHATVAYDPNDPDSQLVGQYSGYCEPSLALLTDGRLLCVMRIQGTHVHGEYRPLYSSWSEDQGKTWTKPEPTSPHLMNISPTLAVLDNGVVACQYGRPGFHVVFSIDGGKTWRDRVSFSDLPEPLITGQFDMVKVGPNRLAAIGSDAEGIKVWPIDVERVKEGRLPTLTGAVVNQEGSSIVGAKVALEPNRYTADCWIDGEVRPNTPGAGRVPVDPPVLGYRSISREKDCPVMESDRHGRFEFKNIKPVEYVLTVEADGYAPQWRHINVGKDKQPQQFQLKAGKSLHGQVVDSVGKPVGGACVVFDRCHIHADSNGFFDWAIDSPVPNEVMVKVCKLYNDNYVRFEKKLTLSRIESQPIVLQRTK